MSRASHAGFAWNPTRGWRRARLAVVVRWHAARLDRELAAGVSPWSSGAHALRALRIIRRRSRTSLARGLTGAVRNASDAGPRFTAAVPPDRAAVVASRPLIEALTGRLRGPEPVAAMLRELLTDPSSPLSGRGDPNALARHLRAATTALDPGTEWE